MMPLDYGKSKIRENQHIIYVKFNIKFTIILTIEYKGEYNG